MTKIVDVTATYQRCNTSGEKCIVRHEVPGTDYFTYIYPEWIDACLESISLHREFLRSGWYLKQFEYNPN